MRRHKTYRPAVLLLMAGSIGHANAQHEQYPPKYFATDLSLVKTVQRPAAQALRKIGAQVSVNKGNVSAVICTEKEFDDTHAQGLRTFPALRALDLSKTGLTKRGLETIAELQTLEYLRVHAPAVEPRDYLVLSSLRNISSVGIGSADDYNAQRITGDLDAELQQGMKGITRFETLDITDVGMKYLAKMLWLKEFHCLSPHVTDNGIEQLEPLQDLREVVLHSIAPPSYTRNCVKSLIQLKKLEFLRLDKLTLQTGDVESLATLSNLAWLDLSFTGVNDDALRHIKNLRKLRYLELQWTNITDAGLKHLAEMPSLRGVKVPFRTVSKAAMKSLEDALRVRHPDATVQY